ncbi:hypothetical protein [Parapedobacter koreensis]|uniref:hypothetical protein n=1 Tax=Parapedobacter koreensis TaxID=332977 RepID=UPI00115FBDCE|nr:hypothetical protein [Parapedobacter koreensis]
MSWRSGCGERAVRVRQTPGRHPAHRWQTATPRAAVLEQLQKRWVACFGIIYVLPHFLPPFSSHSSTIMRVLSGPDAVRIWIFYGYAPDQPRIAHGGWWEKRDSWWKQQLKIKTKNPLQMKRASSLDGNRTHI